jgi:hypothetical protein
MKRRALPAINTLIDKTVKRYIHVGDGNVDYRMSYFCRIRCFCSLIYKFICTSIPDHEDLGAFQLLLPAY